MSVNNFKVIVALKSQKDLKQGQIRCAISIQDKVKFTVLPQSEGQFFDINDLAIGKPITIMFDIESTGQRIGDLEIMLPPNIYHEKEVELADTFTLEYEAQDKQLDKFSGRYYIIVLNKGEIKVEKPLEQEQMEEQAIKQIQESHVARQSESPTKQYIKSTGERTQERTKKEQTKKLLNETKYDTKHQKKPSQQLKKSANKKSSKEFNKYSSQKQLEKSGTLESAERMRTPPKRQESPYNKYRGGQSEEKLSSKGQQEVEYWKGVAVEMQSNTERIEGNNEINEGHLEELSKSENKRNELQNLIREGIDEGVKLREEIEKKLNELINDNSKLQKQVKSQNEQIGKLEKTVDNKNLEISKKDNEIGDLQKKLKNMEEVKRICGVQQNKLEEQQQKLKNQQKNFDDSISDLVNQIARLEGQYTQIMGEKQESDLNLQECLKSLQTKNEQIKNLEQQLQNSRNETELKSSWELSAMTLKQQNNDLNLQVLDYQHRLEQLQQLIQQLRDDINALDMQKDNMYKDFTDRQNTLKEVIKGQDIKINELEQYKKQQDKQILLLKQQVQQLQIKSNQFDDLSKQYRAQKQDYENLLKDNDKLSNSISELTESLQSTNNQILELRAEILSQNKQLDQKDQYSNNLKKVILEMKERGIAYIPAQGDNLDTNLAVFINQRDDADQLTQLFSRENHGVYQFGSKKIYIKQEQDKILIRSGGGFISIEEFLNLYSQREMDILSRQDPLVQIAKNKAVSRKTNQMKSLGKKNSSYD